LQQGLNGRGQCIVQAAHASGKHFLLRNDRITNDSNRIFSRVKVIETSLDQQEHRVVTGQPVSVGIAHHEFPLTERRHTSYLRASFDFAGFSTESSQISHGPQDYPQKDCRDG
jgi:hypothetical protein